MRENPTAIVTCMCLCTHKHKSDLCVLCDLFVKLKKGQRANTSSCKQALSQNNPFVSVVTGSSRGLKGQSSSSESARSTTTPGWRHWVGRWWWVRHGLLCMHVCVRGDGWYSYALYILDPIACKVGLKKPWELWYVTYIVDVGNVIFVNSNCLLKKRNIYIFKKQYYHTAQTQFLQSLCESKEKGPLRLPQPASWILQSLSPWSGNACRSPRPPCIHSSSFWRISLHTKTRGLLTDKHLVHLFWLSSVKWTKKNPAIYSL